jgi:hypothetical protein
VSDRYRFAGVARGRALRGSRAIAEYLLSDPEASEIVCSLPRDEFGLVMLGRDLTGFSGWLDRRGPRASRQGAPQDPAEGRRQNRPRRRRLTDQSALNRARFSFSTCPDEAVNRVGLKRRERRP